MCEDTFVIIELYHNYNYRFITTHIVNVIVIIFIIVIIVFHKFIIEGTVGYGSSGDIALDDLTLLDGNCKTVITQSK